ncbi:DUF1254 domain-containing protein [Microbacterium sp. Marseille-Q6648]|uniref:DUF1254 domain-containing protein n=1 Tax=Microbacterium sp. Marseille-Q6648 TaxID=2937991 RepID=UPI00203FBD12|nr:DUF1254 domain-containing protein [Microbacterium sp. Marseille-Q6648]
MARHVNVDNFVRAETDRMFADIQRDAGGVNVFRHNREPAAIDEQTVIRLNRDTLYSFAIVDLVDGASIEIPEHGDRYVSVMVVDNDHYVRAVLHEPGHHDLAAVAPGTRYALVAVRTLVDPSDAADIAAVASLQDEFRLEVASGEPFESPEYDAESLEETRNGLLRLARGLRAFDRTFGGPDEVDPVRHLIGTAAGWGGLPLSEASYLGVSPGVGVGHYELTMHDVPVDAFWSVSVYNAQGYFEPNDDGRYTVNSITGVPDEDGAITVRFTPPGEATGPNDIPVPEGWNYLVRLYRPRPEFFEGGWEVPDLVRLESPASPTPAQEDAAQEDAAQEDAAQEDGVAMDATAEDATIEDATIDASTEDANAEDGSGGAAEEEPAEHSGPDETPGDGEARGDARTASDD